jgi:hypothetical protein
MALGNLIVAVNHFLFFQKSRRHPDADAAALSSYMLAG